MGFSYVSMIDDSTTGGTGADAAIARQAQEIIVGHEHFLQPRRRHQHYFRGAAHFDLSRITAIPSKVVTRAVLQYRLRGSSVRDAAGTPESFPLLTSCASELLVADSDWRTGPAEPDGVIISDKSPISGEPLQPLSTVPPPGGGTLYTADITPIAQRWVARPEENFGIVLRGAREPPQPADNSRCTSAYGDFVLKVDFTVFVK